MLKKTLHTAVAAIAVSTMCLPTAEAKEDLIVANMCLLNEEVKTLNSSDSLF